MALVRDIFNCQFDGDYLEHISGKSASTSQTFMTRNRRMWEACYHRHSLCYHPQYVARMCTHFSVQLMKVVRMRLAQSRQLVQHFGDSLKIVYLVRDPRGIMASRANLTWCGQPPCSDVDLLCRQTDEDVALLRQLRQQQPATFYLLRFEDLSADVEAETGKLFHFLGLKITMPVRVFLTTHTRASGHNHKDPYATSRQSQSVASEWRNKLSQTDISSISSRCAALLKNLDYQI